MAHGYGKENEREQRSRSPESKREFFKMPIPPDVFVEPVVKKKHHGLLLLSSRLVLLGINSEFSPPP
jgi:hypothetical protein